MIKKIEGRLVGRERVVWTTVSNRVNELHNQIDEIIDFLNELSENEAITALLRTKKDGGKVKP